MQKNHLKSMRRDRPRSKMRYEQNENPCFIPLDNAGNYLWNKPAIPCKNPHFLVAYAADVHNSSNDNTKNNK